MAVFYVLTTRWSHTSSYTTPMDSTLTGKRSEQIVLLQAALNARGAASHCHLLAEHSAMDGERLTITDALDRTSDHGCAVLICLPDKLALYLPEAPAKPVILLRGA